IISKITFGYYQPKVTVKLYADDVTSGIDYMEWSYQRAEGASTVNVKNTSGKIERNKLSFSNNGRTAMGKITLTAGEAKQYRGNITFSVTDMAGNTSKNKTDEGEIIVVDSISPIRTVTYSTAKQVVDSKTEKTKTDFDYSSENAGVILYYDAEMTMTFQITEANFYKEDVNVFVKKREVSQNEWGKEKEVSVKKWSQDGDVWTGSIQLSGEGDYIVTIKYTDRSSNEMITYTSDQITIDNTIPAIDVKYSPDNYVLQTEEKRYYAEKQKAEITINEHNFRADDVNVEIIAQSVTGDSIVTQDYTEYLKNPDSWVENGDIHTATIEFPLDANYTFDIDYTDLALHQAADYEPDMFAVDTKEPENLTVEYSTNVFETILGTITFGFYNAQMTVTMTAEDQTSGIYQFTYTYRKSEGVSDVNAGAEDIVIEESDIDYSEGNRLATATFQIPSAELRGDNQFNGTVSFNAMDRAGLLMDLEDETRIIVDNIAPTAEIEYSEPVQVSGDIAYYSDAIDATITVTEANFYSEDVVVTVERDGQTAQPVDVVWTDQSVDTHIGSFELSGDGDYVVYVSYEDRSQNVMEEYHSEQLTIDTTQPTITVRGIGNHTANREETIGFEVIVEDTNFDINTFQPKLMAEVMDENGTIHSVDMSSLGNVSTMAGGTGYIYTVANLEQDAVYTLTCDVADLASNQIADMVAVENDGEAFPQLMFSVNRNGSTYSFSDATRALNGTFVREPVDVVVTEINVDELETSKVTMFKNDETIALSQGNDYRLSMEGGNGTWYAYTYDVYDQNFMEDGIYRLSFYSEDAAGNIAENTLDSKNMEISFGVDKTQPNLIVTNLESETTYPVENLNVVMQANDNMKLVTMQVELDGEVCASWGAEEIEEKTKELSDYSFDISGDDTHAHDVRITLSDAAGNETVEEIKDFYVTTNMWVRYYNNKPLFFGTIGGGIVVVASPAAAVVLIRRRKRIGVGK
ncbi:MAG: hypothetical protein ACI4AD_06690, partial [Roseburia sp.]